MFLFDILNHLYTNVFLQEILNFMPSFVFSFNVSTVYGLIIIIIYS